MIGDSQMGFQHTHVIDLRLPLLVGSHTAQLKSCSLVCRSSRMSPRVRLSVSEMPYLTALFYVSAEYPGNIFPKATIGEVTTRASAMTPTAGHRIKRSWCQIHNLFRHVSLLIAQAGQFASESEFQLQTNLSAIIAELPDSRNPWLPQKKKCFPVVFPTASYRFSKAPGIKRQIARIQAFGARG